MAVTITLDDGRVFPVFDGKSLSWSIGLYFTPNEEKAGYPRIRAVCKAAKELRPKLIADEERILLSAQFDRVFGGNATRLLDLLRSIQEEV